MDWLFARQGYSKHKNDFLKLLDFLHKVGNENLNATTLMKALMIPVHKLINIIVVWIYLPFLAQSIVCIVFFSWYLAFDEPVNSFWIKFWGTLILILSAYFEFIEFLQFSE